MNDMDKYKEAFVTGAEEYLKSLNQGLLDLESSPDDEDAINEMFRAAHTLKGMSGAMGYNDINQLSHKMENVMDVVRSKKVSVSSEMVELLFDCFDSLEEMVERIDADEDHSMDISNLIINLGSFLSNEKESSEKVSTSDASELNELQYDADTYNVTVCLKENCALKSIRAFMVRKNLGSVGEILEIRPSEETIEADEFGCEFSLVIQTGKGEEGIRKVIDSVSEIESIDVVNLCKNDGKAPAKKQAATPKKSTGKKVTKSIKSVRINIERLDSLMNTVGELVINKIRLIQIATTNGLGEISEALSGLDRLTTDLQNEVMQMRMVEVAQIFDRFPRMVRDLAKAEGKEVNFEITGKDIELDRTVLDEIGDPLVHLLRNAVDHGMESPDERANCGKSRSGTVRLSASREKDHLKITIEDDGKGIDVEAIRKSAVEKGNISKEVGEKATREEILNLLFAPGVSTAKKVTDVSGRGVGMDVAKTKITSLGGTIDFTTELGKGSRFTLKLPLTVAIIQALLVNIEKGVYAIPLNSIKETVHIKSDDVCTVMGKETTILRESVMPLMRLSEKLVGPNGNGENVTKDCVAVVVEKDGKPVGLVVDSLIAQQEIVIKTLDRSSKTSKHVAGATILGDGRVALILDTGTLI